MRVSGINVFSKTLDPKEYTERLKQKLLEEAQEVAEASEKHHLLGELADVLEAVHALADAHGIAFEDLERQRLAKKDAKGGFGPEHFVDYIETDASHPSFAHYEKRSEKYPSF